ncbi:MAG: hypothetical protein PHX08_26035 [Lachnospiraceae bacterium]|nr:hypothetical protein [Lachnospiraceae bacterium]
MKIGKNDFSINKNDLILDDGMSYRLITKELGRGLKTYFPVISKSKFAELQKKRIVYTNSELKNFASQKYGSANCTYWKFDMEKVARMSKPKYNINSFRKENEKDR